MTTKKIITFSALLLCLVGGAIFNHSIASQKKNEFKEETKDEPKITINNPVAEADQKTNVEDTNKNLNVPILMYHHIRDLNDSADPIGENLSVSPANFAAQLDFIASRGYKTETFESIKGNKATTKAVILTFDDGYENFYQFAYPELKKRGMVSVLYVIAGRSSGEYVTREQIKEISDSGFEIGSHTISHLDLSAIDITKARDEIFLSKQQLETLISKPVISFCYPSGKYDSTTVDLLKEAGYEYAVTTKLGITDFQNPFELSRYRMNKDTNIKGYIR